MESSTHTHAVATVAQGLLLEAALAGVDYDEAKHVLAAIVAFTADWDKAMAAWADTLNKYRDNGGSYDLWTCWIKVRQPLLVAKIASYVKP